MDHVVGQRMKRNGHMRWTRREAHSLLQVRCAVLNGQYVRNFKRLVYAFDSTSRDGDEALKKTTPTAENAPRFCSLPHTVKTESRGGEFRLA